MSSQSEAARAFVTKFLTKKEGSVLRVAGTGRTCVGTRSGPSRSKLRRFRNGHWCSKRLASPGIFGMCSVEQD